MIAITIAINMSLTLKSTVASFFCLGGVLSLAASAVFCVGHVSVVVKMTCGVGWGPGAQFKL